MKARTVPGLRIMLLGGIVLWLSACSREHPKGESRHQTTLAQIDGDVFIVTRGGINYKMGLVPVAAIPESVIISYIGGRQGLMAATKVSADSIMAVARDDLGSARRAGATAKAHYENLLRRRQERYDAVTSAALDEAWNAYQTAAAVEQNRAGRIATLESSRSFMGSPEFYFSDLPQAVATTKTDADGKFVLTLPIARRYVLAAAASREIAGSTEKYYWLIWVTPNASNPTRVLLSNDNLMTVPSADCVVLAREQVK